VAIFVLEKTLFLDDVDVLVPRQLVVAVVVVDLAGAGETAGGGVRVRRRTHGAEHRRGMQRRGCFFSIVGRALNVVHCSTWRPRGGRRIQACHLGVCLRMMHRNQSNNTTLLLMFVSVFFCDGSIL